MIRSISISTARIAEVYSGAIATGENLFSAADVKNLLLFAGARPGLDLFQMDAGLSYGLGEYGHMLDLMEEHGFERASSPAAWWPLDQSSYRPRARSRRMRGVSRRVPALRRLSVGLHGWRRDRQADRRAWFRARGKA